MNKKFVGALALTAVAVGGVVYYRYVQSTDRNVAQEIRERALRLFASDLTEEGPDEVTDPKARFLREWRRTSPVTDGEPT